MSDINKDSLQIPEEKFLFSEGTVVQKTKCYIETNFHHFFLERLAAWRNHLIGNIGTLVGIQGIGKTTTAIFFVSGNKDVYYVDLKYFENLDNKRLDRFRSYSENMQEKGLLIIDHVSLMNRHLIKDIERIVAEKKVRLLLIETGLTASTRYGRNDFGRIYQLKKEEFVKIWLGNILKEMLGKPKSKYLEEISETVYTELKSEGFVVTPRALHALFCEIMYRFNEYELISSSPDNSIIKNAVLMWKMKQVDKINHFLEKYGKHKELNEFILHARILLYLISFNGRDCIIHFKVFEFLCIPLNIFHCETIRVSKEKMEEDVRIQERNFCEGDWIVYIGHLEPILGAHWRKKLPFCWADLELDLQSFSDMLLDTIFNGGGHKELEKKIVEYQKQNLMIILPYSHQKKTDITCGGKTFPLVQWTLFLTEPLKSFYLEKIKEDKYKSDVEVQEYSGHRLTVALYARWVREKILEGASFLMYPQISTFKGIDYFVYICPELDTAEPCKKKPKEESVLYLVQVAIGKSHDGSTLSDAFSIVDKIVGIPDLIIHVVVLVATDTKEFTLTGDCSFSNLSVINLYDERFLKQDATLRCLFEKCVFCEKRSRQ